MLDRLPGLDTDLARDFQRLPGKLQQSLSDSLINFTTTDDTTQDAFLRVMQELTRSRRVVTVGFWDVGANIPYLTRFIDQLNAVQPRFAFFEVHAAIPAGLISRPERVKQWAISVGESEDLLADLKNNLIDDDFFSRAEGVRKDLGINFIIGFAPSMVAGIDGKEVFWNHFASIDRRAALVSSYQMREFARKAERPLESGVALVALSALLIARNPGLEYHKDTGCLFDRNEKRESLIADLRKPMIDERCLQRIRPIYRDAAQQFVKLLSKYSYEPVDAADSDWLKLVQTQWLIDSPPETETDVYNQASPSVSGEEEDRFLHELLELPEFRSQPDLAGAAVKVMRQLRDPQPDQEKTATTDSDVNYKLALQCKERGLIDDAIGHFQLASKDPQRAADSASMLGVCFLEKGMPDLALKWYRKAIEISKIDPEERVDLLNRINEITKPE